MAGQNYTQQLLRSREAASRRLPLLDANKRSVCIKGAWMAFAHVKMQWAKMNAAMVATEGPPAGKEHRTPERCFSEVLEGSHLVAEQCSKDVIFE